MASDQQQVLVAYDGSEGANAAIQAAARLFAERPLLVLSVGRSLASVASAAVVALPAGVVGEAVARMDEAAQRESKSLAEAGAQAARDHGAQASATATLSDGAVWETIVQAAEEHDAAVIIVGSRGLSNVKSMLLGSVSNAVLHQAARPVLVVPGSSVGSERS